MNTVTQTMQFRQSLLNYAEKGGVNRAAIKYNMNRNDIHNSCTGPSSELAHRSGALTDHKPL